MKAWTAIGRGERGLTRFVFHLFLPIDLNASSIRSRDTVDGSPCGVPGMKQTHAAKEALLFQELYVEDARRPSTDDTFWGHVSFRAYLSTGRCEM